MSARVKLAFGLVCTFLPAMSLSAQWPGLWPVQRVIVTLTPATDPVAAANSAAAHGAFVTHTLHHGFSGILPEKLISQLRHQSDVTSVEPDQLVHTAQLQCVTQSSVPSWGLDRISERAIQLDGNYEYEYTGAGVKVYVLDSGIDASNPDLAGRVVAGASEVPGAAQECNGHGTAVAGSIGGTLYGVAKNVSLTSVRVLNCGGLGFVSDVAAGLEWATDDHIANGKPAVAVMAFEGPYSPTLNAEMANAQTAGLGSVVAAGNDHADACKYSPASAPEALAVAATDNTDTRAAFSNGGSCVGIFAPGVNVATDWLRGQVRSVSGTSISAALAGGVSALTLEEHPTWTFDQVKAHLTEKATNGVVNEPTDDCSGRWPRPSVCAPPSPNLMLYSACDI